MIEAMACGTPVIAWPRGSVPEEIEHGVTGFIVESEADAGAAISRARHLDLGRIRETFERRFVCAKTIDTVLRHVRAVSPRRNPQAAEIMNSLFWAPRTMVDFAA